MKRRDFIKSLAAMPVVGLFVARRLAPKPALGVNDDEYYLGNEWHNDPRATEAIEVSKVVVKSFANSGMTICGPCYYKEEDGEIKELHPGCKHGFTEPVVQEYLAYWNNPKKYQTQCRLCVLVRKGQK